MAVVLGFPGSWLQDPETGIDYTMVVHGEEAIRLHQSDPAGGHGRLAASCDPCGR